jgi:hypothetical protein
MPDGGQDPDWSDDYVRVEVDPRGLRELADALGVELRENYVPQRDRVDEAMIVPSAAPDFPELLLFLERHRESQEIATALLAEHGNATGALAHAAEVIARRYGDADGLAAARAREVRDLLAGRS